MKLTRATIPLILAGTVAFGAISADAATPPDPLLGSWSYNGGKIRFSKSGSNFRGAVTTPIKLGTCTFASGTQLLTVKTLTKNSYVGTHTGDVTAKPCQTQGTGVANILLIKQGASLRASICFFPPDGSRRKRCYVLRRAA